MNLSATSVIFGLIFACSNLGTTITANGINRERRLESAYRNKRATSADIWQCKIDCFHTDYKRIGAIAKIQPYTISQLPTLNEGCRSLRSVYQCVEDCGQMPNGEKVVRKLPIKQLICDDLTKHSGCFAKTQNETRAVFDDKCDRVRITKKFSDGTYRAYENKRKTGGPIDTDLLVRSLLEMCRYHKCTSNGVKPVLEKHCSTDDAGFVKNWIEMRAKKELFGYPLVFWEIVSKDDCNFLFDAVIKK